MVTDTIFALASGRGSAGVAVIRVSGDRAFETVRAMTGRALALRDPSLRILRDSTGDPLDEALLLGFASGASFTGEEAVEIQCHGSPAVVAAIEDCLRGYGLRHAEPGEFTRRAFLNGRLDLAQVEGLADLVAAETEAQRKQALGVMQGALSDQTMKWRDKLIHAMALVTATIDFADEEVPVDVSPEVGDLIAEVRGDFSRELSGISFRERVRNGFEVALVGAPNAGKSTLLNYLAGRDAAITSDIPGTTRDIVEVRMTLEGLPVTFLDTAGLRDTEDQVEQMGIERTQSRSDAADLRVFLGRDGLDAVGFVDGDIVVSSKSDIEKGDDLNISGKTGDGVEALLDHIVTELSGRAIPDTTATHARHRDLIAYADQFLAQAQQNLGHLESHPELISETLREAVTALSSLIGDVDVEHILDQVFSRFCLGK